jgi:peptide/nickel transport system substrate-binding protein
MKKLCFVLITICLLTTLIISCGKAATPATTPTPTTTTPTTPVTTETTSKYGGTFRIMDQSGPRPSNNIGWYSDTGFAGFQWVSAIGETLWRVKISGEFVPFLATDWELASDSKSINITIRQGVKFQDGTVFDAEAVKWNFDQYIAAGGSTSLSLDSVDVVGDYEVRVNLKSYINTLLYNLGSYMFVSPTAYEQNGVEWMMLNPVTTGPFKVVSYDPGVLLKAEKNPDYWQEGKPYLDSVEFTWSVDGMTRSNAFLAGEVDAEGGDLTKTEYDLAQQGYELIKAYTGVWGLITDTDHEDSPFSKLEVRQALDYAINREELVASLGYGLWEPNYQFAIPGTPAYVNNLEKRSYDPDKARQLLEEAGYSGGFDTRIIGAGDVQTAIQGYLSEVGINASIESVDAATNSNYIRQGFDNAMHSTPFGLDININSTISRLFITGSVFWPNWKKFPEFEALYQASADSPEYDGVLAQKMVKYIYDNALITVIYLLPRGAVVQPYVRDTGMYTYSGWPTWDPADTWLDK